MNNYWSKEDFIIAVKQSTSISEVLRFFGIPANRGSYYNKLFHQSVKELNLDISHIISNVNKRKNRFKKIPTEELLVKGKYKSTSSFKKRLLKEDLLQDKCYECNLLPEWNNKPLSLQLDHVNGDNTDNRLENLRLLCPNCHSQTETYAGSKKKKEKHKHKFVCKLCSGPKKSSKSDVCTKCVPKKLPQNRKSKINWAEPEKVLQMTKDLGFSETGRQLGVSDNAVRKFLKRNNLL